MRHCDFTINSDGYIITFLRTGITVYQAITCSPTDEIMQWMLEWIVNGKLPEQIAICPLDKTLVDGLESIKLCSFCILQFYVDQCKLSLSQ